MVGVVGICWHVVRCSADIQQQTWSKPKLAATTFVTAGRPASARQLARIGMQELTHNRQRMGGGGGGLCFRHKEELLDCKDDASQTGDWLRRKLRAVSRIRAGLGPALHEQVWSFCWASGPGPDVADMAHACTREDPRSTVSRLRLSRAQGSTPRALGSCRP